MRPAAARIGTTGDLRSVTICSDGPTNSPSPVRGCRKGFSAGPAWLRRVLGAESFQNIILVKVADADDPATYLHHVASLPVVVLYVVVARRYGFRFFGGIKA